MVKPKNGKFKLGKGPKHGTKKGKQGGTTVRKKLKPVTGNVRTDSLKKRK